VEEAVRARFEARIGYFEAAIRDGLRVELERLLTLESAVQVRPHLDVTRDEMVTWLLERGWCLHRGGNNPLGLPDELCEAAREQNEAMIGRTRGSNVPAEDIDAVALRRAGHALHHADPTLVRRWKGILLAERLDRATRMLESGLQAGFAESIGRLRAEAASGSMVVGPADMGITSDPEEHGATFAENALIKARHFQALGKLPTMADDSGIVVEALQGELGISTRRWGAGPNATDQEWIDFFLKRMSKENNKKATFVCCIAYIDAQGREHVFNGACSGVITDTLEADYLPGLPISGCFKPDGFTVVYSAMKVEQKNRTSHRGRALKEFREFLLRN
jgi:XTP/dITP diphosphohydrolase